jgi:hypothetical protein
MTGGRGSRRRVASGDTSALAALAVAYSAAPVAVSAASGLLVGLGVADVIAASRAATAGVVALVVASMVTFGVALGARGERAFLTSVLFISAASAFADLHVYRGDRTVFAAVAGAIVLGVIEAGGAALEPKGGGSRLGRPARLHVAWVVAVAAGGAAAGWLLVSLQPDVADLGLVALGCGVLAAVGLVVFAGALTGSALGDGAGFVGGSAGGPLGQGPAVPGGGSGAALNSPEQPAPSRRDRRRARGTRRAPPARPPRSAPSSG